MDQLALFADQPWSHRPAPTGRWLETAAYCMDLLASTPTLVACSYAAAESVRGHRTMGREYGKLFENALLPMLLDRDTAARISAEWVSVGVRAGHKHFSRVEIIETHGTTSPADIGVRLCFTNRTPIVLPVNVKTAWEDDTSTTAGMSLRAFVRYLTEPSFDILGGSARQAAPVDRAIMEWATGARELVPDRDYYLLVARTDRHTQRLASVAFQGLLSRVTRSGDIAVGRATTRENVTFHLGATMILPRHLDIEHAVVRAMLPASSWDAVRVHLASTIVNEGGNAAETVSRLLTLTDAQLRRAIELIE